MSNTHRLFVQLFHPKDESQTNLVKQDMRWARLMDVAISTAVLAMSCGLDQGTSAQIYEEYLELLPKEKDTEHLSDTAYAYYHEQILPVEQPWGVRNICDFILALAHRKYAFQYDRTRWLDSRFKAVPVGLPRTRNRTVSSRNHTAHNTATYRSYQNRLVMGKIIVSPKFLSTNNGSWVPLPGRPIELTETTPIDWLHTKISELPMAWDLLEVLFQMVLHLDEQPNNSEKLTAVIGGVAQLHWWFSQAMPYRRGSAAVGDMLTKALLQYHEITTPYWRVGVGPDLEAFCSSLEDYVVTYPKLFLTKPIYINSIVQ